MTDLRRKIADHRRLLRGIADAVIVVSALTVAAIAYVRYDAKHQRLPGRAGETWVSPDGRTRIVERIIDDGGATVGFYRNLYVEQDREFEWLASFHMEPRLRLVASCVWRGSERCTITVDPQARYAWLESPPKGGTFDAVAIIFRAPR